MLSTSPGYSITVRVEVPRWGDSDGRTHHCSGLGGWRSHCS